jgi:hypothetical protein
MGSESVLMHGRCWRRSTERQLAPKAEWRAGRNEWLRCALDEPCGSALAYSGPLAAANAAKAFAWFAPELGELTAVRCSPCDAWHVGVQTEDPPVAGLDADCDQQ